MELLGVFAILAGVVFGIIFGIEQICQRLFDALEGDMKKKNPEASLPLIVKVVVPWMLCILLIGILRLDYIGIMLNQVGLGWNQSFPADFQYLWVFDLLTLLASGFFAGLGSNGWHEWFSSVARKPKPIVGEPIKLIGYTKNQEA